MLTEAELTLPQEGVDERIELAREHYRRAHGYSVQLMLDLDWLFLRAAHKARGFSSFSVWAEQAVGVPASTVRGLARQGRCLAILADRGRVDLEDPASCPSQAALRGLARVRGRRGDAAMVEVFDHCLSNRGRVTEAATRDAERDLYHPQYTDPDKPDLERERGLTLEWALDDEPEAEPEIVNAFDLLYEDLSDLSRLAARSDRERFRSKLRDVECDLADLRELVEGQSCPED